MLGDGPRFLNSVPCCDSELVGSAINDFDLLLVVSVRDRAPNGGGLSSGKASHA